MIFWNSRLRKLLFVPHRTVTCLIQARELVYQLTRRRIVVRYRGSMLGLVWTFVSPALQLAIYTLVFGVIFKPRWSTTEASTVEYALLLYLGLTVFWFASECFAEAPGIVVQHSNYVKKVIFPLEILPWVIVSTATFHWVIRVLVFMVAYMYLEGGVRWTMILLPLVWLPIALMTVGLSWFLAALGVFIRDLGEVVSFGLTAILFLSPVFYPVESVPETYRWIITFNPISHPISYIRDIAYWGTVPDIKVWTGAMAASVVVAWLGHAFFMSGREAFSDVL